VSGRVWWVAKKCGPAAVMTARRVVSDFSAASDSLKDLYARNAYTKLVPGISRCGSVRTDSPKGVLVA
jgi:hypothetical protein